MKRVIFIIVAICVSSLSFFLFTGCPSAPGYYIKFKLDGEQKNFDKGLTNYESEPFGNTVTIIEDLFAMYATPDVETGDTEPDNYISVLFRGTTIGTYSDTAVASLYYRENGNGWWEGGPVDNIVIVVTKYDDEGGVVEGTFSTTIVEEGDGLTKEITEGKFRVKRLSNDTLIPWKY